MLFQVLSGQFTQQVIQTLKASLPNLPVAFEPRVCLGKWARFQPAWPALSVASTRNQTGLLENPEVLRNGRLANGEGLHQLANGGLT